KSEWPFSSATRRPSPRRSARSGAWPGRPGPAASGRLRPPWTTGRHAAAARSGRTRGRSGCPSPPPASPPPGRVDAGMRRKQEEEQARQHKESLETLQRGLDEVQEHIDGRLPTLTGIRFDQDGLTTTLGQVEGELKQNTFTVGWSHHLWPPVR